MNAGQRDEFFSVARRFGITPAALEACKMVVLKTGGNSVQELRETISMADDAMRKERALSFFDNLGGRAKIGQGVHDRLEAYIFADSTFSAEDIAGMNRHVPIPMKVTCAQELTVKPGETLDVTAQAADWGRGKGDDLISVLHVGTLRLGKGATVQVRGNLFVLICQEILHDGGRIAILPTDFSYDKSYGDTMDGRDGTDGADAPVAKPTRNLPVTTSVFGDFYDGPPQGILHGAAGQRGGDGEEGGRGCSGGALKIAELTIRSIVGEQPLAVDIAGGDGGDGGGGGCGGGGSDGAPGGGAYRTLYDRFPAGDGGCGGDGGDGGKGGRGGHGGLSSNVYIEVPDPERLAITASPGRGGIGGKGGSGGGAGRGGDPGGADGTSGQDGKDGVAGHARPAAAVFVCGRRLVTNTYSNARRGGL